MTGTGYRRYSGRTWRPTVEGRVETLLAKGAAALAARGKGLRALSRERVFFAPEAAELDAVDAALGQHALVFDPPSPSTTQNDVHAGYDLARAGLETRARTPLRGADLQTQASLFDEPGQMALF